MLRGLGRVLDKTYIIRIWQRWECVLESLVAKCQSTSMTKFKGISGDRKHVPTSYVKVRQCADNRMLTDGC
jgi:hypothetical protein